MDLYIPTRGRTDLQRTLQNLTPKLRKKATLVIDDGDHEKEHYTLSKMMHCGVWVLPKRIRGIAAIRQHIMDESGSKKLVMLDDDLRFQFKRRDGTGIFASTPQQTEDTFEWLEKQLKDVAHAGIVPRSIYYDRQNEFVEAFRMMHVLAYDVKRVKAAGAKFTHKVDSTRFTMDDFHLTLQLIEAGEKNRVSLRYNSNPSSSNSRGGASLWRTLESHNYSARTLGHLHRHVKVVPKHQWQGMDGTRYDVVIYWQKIAKAAGINLGA